MNAWLQPRNLRFVSIAIVVAGVVALAISLATVRGGRTPFGSLLGGDYAAFYVAGKILNEHSADRLYDRALQNQLFHELMPAASPEESLPYAYPPFVAMLFRPLASLPYRLSYLVWLVVSLTFYVAGARLAIRRLPEEHRWTALWLALSFEPFLFECWIGGQLSVLGFFAIALALEQRNAFAAGLAWGMCLYKPTLLLLVLPALVVGRQWRMLSGAIVTGVVLAAVSWLAVGGGACAAYAATLGDYLRATVNAPEAFRVWKFVDARSFFVGLLGRPSALSWLAIGVMGLAVLWRWREPDRQRPWLWAATLTATLVANIYVGVYDSILIVLSTILMFGALPRTLLVLVYLAPWLSQWLAQVTGIQAFTLILAATGIYQLVLLRQDSLESPA